LTPNTARLGAFQFLPHHAQNPSASVYEVSFLCVGHGKTAGRGETAGRGRTLRQMRPDSAPFRLGCSVKNPSASVCGIILLNADQGEARRLSVLAAPRAEPTRRTHALRFKAYYFSVLARTNWRTRKGFTPNAARLSAFQVRLLCTEPKRFGLWYHLAICQSRRSSTPFSSRCTTRRTQALRFMRY